MTAREAQVLRDKVARAKLEREPASRRARLNTAPISFVRCPVHRKKLGRDGEGVLLGRCDGCASDCATALRWLRDHPVPA